MSRSNEHDRIDGSLWGERNESALGRNAYSKLERAVRKWGKTTLGEGVGKVDLTCGKGEKGWAERYAPRHIRGDRRQTRADWPLGLPRDRNEGSVALWVEACRLALFWTLAPLQAGSRASDERQVGSREELNGHDHGGR